MRRLAFVIAMAVTFAGWQSASARPISFDDLVNLGQVSDPQFSPDGKWLAYVVTWADHKDNTSNSDIYLVPAGGGEARRLTRREGRDNQPRFSPDGQWIAFTSSRSGKSQIWLLSTSGGEAKQLTELSTGASSPMWTPDGGNIVFRSRVYPDCSDDECNEQRLKELKDTKTGVREYADLFYQHWDHWRDERRSHLMIVGVNGGTARDLTPYTYEVPTVALGSAHDVAVSPDGKEICVTVNVDDDMAVSINNDLYTLPISGGRWTRITDNPANDNHPVYSPDGRYIAYRAMTRAGFEADEYRLKLYDRRGKKHVDVGGDIADKFDRSIGSIAWSTDSKSLFVTCNDAGYNSLFRVDASDGSASRLTNRQFVSSLRVSPDGKRLAFLQQSAVSPSEVYTADRSGKGIRQVSFVNTDKLTDLEMNPLESFTFTGAEGDPVHGFLLKPPGFQPGKKYPMVYLVHGGPQGAWRDTFHPRWNFQMWAAPGYVVAMVNPRGSSGYGQQFTDEITRDWGGKVYEDLMAGLDFVLDEYDFIDADNVASAGGSYGGYMMGWFAGHTDRFKTLVNHAGVFNLESFYGTTEELWFPEWEFGGPYWKGTEDYSKWSPHKYAANFKTPMLILHGAMDFRVPLAEGRQAFTAHRRQGIDAKLVVFPDEGHWILKPQNRGIWWRNVHEWLDKYLEDEKLVP